MVTAGKNGHGQQQAPPPEVQFEIAMWNTAQAIGMRAYFALRQQAHELMQEEGVTAADLECGYAPTVPAVEVRLKKPKSSILIPTLMPQNLGDLKRGG